MRLVTYVIKEDVLNIRSEVHGDARIGWVQDGYVWDIGFAQEWAILEKGIPFPRALPTDMVAFLETGANGLVWLRQVIDACRGTQPDQVKVEGEPVALSLAEVRLLPPVPRPPSFRDFYAFEQHVKTARARRGLDMIPEWYHFPVFYFSNHQTILAHEQPVSRPSGTQCLDYELEVACIIGKKGRNIPRESAREYIAGLCILNDWSARDVQLEEMKVGLGPAKGKDFATSLGPWLVTLDELEDRRNGDHWDLAMTARVNGVELSHGNLRDLHFSFSEMIERASQDVFLYPGDVIGSGTVGTGCILELGTEVHRWLEPGDVIELEVERLGVLRNRIVERCD
ncbi:fumarylacetoacetase [Polycladomyces abyssicola]|uniref:Fumarylacetoacetase n=1 Tax=Polycladomyces abyssicola TaxID=1125966 RepID=A0A8D5ZLR3_9BACL|nr:fumarylacetoacetate hydrolase family protein [Polycladomyces abyssicola]BCU82799.1 fumarylacetoacetase [Polycladomyces abyssicola]